MSNIVTGQAPTVNYLLNLTASTFQFSDTDAVNHLLNNTSSKSYGSYTQINSNTTNLMNGMIVSTQANKSLLVFNNVAISGANANVTATNITVNNNSIIDTFTYNASLSNVLRADQFRFKVTTPNTDLDAQTNPYVPSETTQTIVLTEVAPTSQNDVNALNDLRVLNEVGAISSGFSLQYPNTQNALGVEGAAYYYNGGAFPPNYKNVSNYSSLAANNITLSIDNLTTSNNYNYEVVKISAGDAFVNMVATNVTNATGSNMTQSAVTYATGASLTHVGDNYTVTYLNFVGSYNYTGLVGQSVMNQLYTQNLVVNSAMSLNITQALSGGNAYMIVDPTFVKMNDLTTLSQVQNLSFADSMNVTVSPSIVSWSGATANIPANTLTIIQAVESLPTGHQLDNATLSFNSSVRSITNATNSYNVTTSIYYAIDGTLNTSLAGSYLTNEFVNLTLKVVDGATINNPAPNSWANSSGYFLWNTYINSTNINATNPIPGAMSVTGPINNDKVSFMTKIMNITTCSFSVNTLNGTYSANSLLALIGGNSSNSNYTATNSFTLSTTYGNPTGASVNGTFNCGAFVAPPLNYSKDNIRVHFTANNPLLLCNSSNTVPINITASNITTANLTTHNITTQYLLGNGVVTYNSNATFGPVSYMDLPSTDKYIQRYILKFPDANEVNGNSVYPESVILQGYSFNSTNGQTVRLDNPAVLTSIPLSFQNGNFQNITGYQRAVVNGTTTTMTYMVKVDLSLSGVKSGSVGVNIPVQYSYDSTNRTWIGGVAPTLSFDITFDTCQLYTHNIALESQQSSSGNKWVNLNTAEPPFNKIDLRRAPYDAIVFSSGDDLYNAIVSVYPALNQDFNNIDYAIPVLGAPTSVGQTGGLKAFIAPVTEGSSLLSAITSLGYNAINFGNVQNVVDNNLSNFTTMDVQLLTGLSGDQLIYPAAFKMSATLGTSYVEFTYIINSGAHQADVHDNVSYGIDLAKSIVNVQDSISGNSTILIGNNQSYQLASGIYVVSNNIEKLVSGQDVARIALTKDKYSASVYNGQFVSNVDIPSNLLLIDGNSYGAGVTTFSLLSNQYRGFKNVADVDVIARTGPIYQATFGPYTQSGSLVPAAAGSPTSLTLNFGNNFGFKLQLIANPITSVNTVFTLNKTQVSVTWGGVTYGYQGGSSLLMSSLINHQNQVPFIDLLFLNNFFIPGVNSATVSYVQPTINVGTSATYAGTNNSTLALTVLQSFTYTNQQSVTDAALIDAGYEINQDQVHLLYSSSYMYRPQARTYYVTVAPMDVTINHRVNNSSVTTNYVSLSTNSQALNITVNGNTAHYTVDFAPNFYVSSLKDPAVSANANLVYNPNLITMQGTPYGGSSWYEYLTLQDLTQAPVTIIGGKYCYQFVQNGVDDPTDTVTLCWTNPYVRPIYDATASFAFNYNWTPLLTVAPQSSSQINQYDLGFAYNSSNVLIPVVTKYSSSYYSSGVNTTAALAVGTTGWTQHLNVISGNLLYINTTALNLPAELPYKYNTTTAYPQPSTRTAVITSTLPITGSALPSQMDLTINVRGAAGVSAYNSYVNVTAGNTAVTKILNVFNKDQMVVQDYLGNLSFRVGPSGRVYGGDISTYSVTVNDNLSNGWSLNGLHIPVFNSDVNLA
jgi:hypothetical protein